MAARQNDAAFVSLNYKKNYEFGKSKEIWDEFFLQGSRYSTLTSGF